jgi:hypothetical protein
MDEMLKKQIHQACFLAVKELGEKIEKMSWFVTNQSVSQKYDELQDKKAA